MPHTERAATLVALTRASAVTLVEVYTDPSAEVNSTIREAKKPSPLVSYRRRAEKASCIASTAAIEPSNRFVVS